MNTPGQLATEQRQALTTDGAVHEHCTRSVHEQIVQAIDIYRAQLLDLLPDTAEMRAALDRYEVARDIGDSHLAVEIADEMAELLDTVWAQTETMP